MDRTINVILKPLRRFAMQKPNASILLFMATILAMLFANSPWAESYHNILSHPIDLKIGNFTPFVHHGEAMPMLAFVNDALMAVFFFVIGLEIKQEILIGELSSVRKALLPIIAACGGMIVPVLFYFLVCHSAPEVRGVAIPMATDIAFALAVLGLLGKRVPLSMRIFLTALAVVDDIGGIIIIALFYSGEIAFEPLLISLALLALLYVGGRMRVNNIAFYYIIGFFVWMLFLESGIHPTIAGVLVAFTVPARPVVKLDDFTCEMTGYLDMLHRSASFPESGGSFIDTDSSSQQYSFIGGQNNQSVAKHCQQTPSVSQLSDPAALRFCQCRRYFRGYRDRFVTGNPVGGILRPVCRKVAGYFPVHLYFCPFASCYDAGRGEQTEPIRGVDVGRYRFYGSSLYREPVFCRDA